MKYPHPWGTKTSRPKASGLHETGGIPGNWALDFMAPGGTLIVASETGVIERLSGHPPSSGTWKNGHPDLAGDVFGWSLYLRCAMGTYFDTHIGVLYVDDGEHVVEGQVLGEVGHWPRDPGRSHTHRGFTSKSGSRAASVKRIEAVRVGEKVRVTWP